MQGEEPLHKEAADGNLANVKFLVRRGLDVNGRNQEGNTPLWEAAKRGHTPVVDYLLLHKADPNVFNRSGWTPLHRAASEGNLQVVESLVGKGADVNAAHQQGATPLFTACSTGQLEVATYMLDRGADANATKADGATPLHWASYFDHREVVRLLLARGASVCALNKDGRSPFDVAKSDDVKKMLFAAGGAGRELVVLLGGELAPTRRRCNLRARNADELIRMIQVTLDLPDTEAVEVDYRDPAFKQWLPVASNFDAMPGKAEVRVSRTAAPGPQQGSEAQGGGGWQPPGGEAPRLSQGRAAAASPNVPKIGGEPSPRTREKVDGIMDTFKKERTNLEQQEAHERRRQQAALQRKLDESR